MLLYISDPAVRALQPTPPVRQTVPRMRDNPGGGNRKPHRRLGFGLAVTAVE